MLNIHFAGQPSMLFDENNVDWASSLYLDHLDHEGIQNVLMARYDRAVQREKQRAF